MSGACGPANREVSDDGSTMRMGCGAWWAALALLSAMLLTPLTMTDAPPLLDYPNHLARLALLAAGPGDPGIFTPRWTIIPNLAIDLIGPPLLRLLPVHDAGRCLLGGVLLLNLAGALALHRALFGRRSFWPLASGLVAYDSTFLLGFLNWRIGCGLAMLCAAGWIAWRERHPCATIAAAVLASIVLFFCHLMGVAFFLILIASAEAHAMRRGQILTRALALLPVLAGPLALSFLTELRDAPAATRWTGPWDKLVQAGSPFVNYSVSLDTITALAVYGGVISGVLAGWIAVAPRARLAVMGLVFLYIALPFSLKGTSFLDTRVAIMLGCLLFAVTDPVRLPRRQTVAACLAALFLTRMAVVTEVWTEYRRDLAAVRAVIATVPPGARVYQMDNPPESASESQNAAPRGRRLSNGLSTNWHLSALLLIEHGAFWQGLFANPAQQPIQLRPAYVHLVQEANTIPSYAALMADPDSGSRALCAFDYALMLETGTEARLTDFVPRYLSLAARNDFAALFQVRRDGPACAPDPPREDASRSPERK